MSNNEFIEFFDGGKEPTLDSLGGKGASLVTMTAAGMPVPPGFVVNTEAFRTFMHSGLSEEIAEQLKGLDPEDVQAADAASAAIREMIISRPVPEELGNATREAYAQLQSRFESEVPLAVRSSATAEDLPDASFAGQQDTYLWLNGYREVAEHIRACFASLYTTRAIIYRIKNQIPDEGLCMAVVVQKMVNAKSAGVAMTLDPTNGDRSKITVDASWGVGEMVVSGTVTPDNIQLDKVTLAVIHEHIGDKHAEMVPDAATNTLVERDVEEARRTVRCLSDTELAAVAQLAKRAEKHYKAPQDIEWAIDADLPEGENLLLLQARPETVHSAKTTEAKPKSTGYSSSLGFGSITASLTKISG
ncbi:PEP/pyruvate-binding domain-containing protein [Glutamicibacter sp. HZAU]|uniref:PEP/pyruvate-binding domain-containing protein n=1 Tax=Glutamicibacter sp. HZAU TaxID=2049891 RepID=UPI000FFB7C36|nr:PEP/pyruvate-binding domain-containing protein [Glutamicibacter sp. HZAU]RWZ85400.1 phosphoenolpyruvate synthase [Glutamicibacter sp. HZAU]